MSKQEVPITPAVLRWALAESGLALGEVAQRVDVDPKVLGQWTAGTAKPSVGEFRKLAACLKRPSATLLLPTPPESSAVSVEFRHPPGAEGRSLNPKERLRLRETVRVQRGMRWVLEELNESKAQLPRFTVQTNPDEAAVKIRELLRVTVRAQLEWKSEHQALAEWRKAFERSGLSVFLFALGKDSARGLSVWDERAPIIAVNTHWNASARIFTLFHELGHLITRTNSACQEGPHRHKAKLDPVERWCEEFAAALLMPWADVRAFLKAKARWDGKSPIRDLGVAAKIAKKFKVSLRACVLRLVNKDVAGWDLYGAIPKAAENKPAGGGGLGRRRARIRFDEYGRRVTSVFVRGMERDVLSRDDVLSYLNIGDSDLTVLVRDIAAP